MRIHHVKLGLGCAQKGSMKHHEAKAAPPLHAPEDTDLQRRGPVIMRKDEASDQSADDRESACPSEEFAANGAAVNAEPHTNDNNFPPSHASYKQVLCNHSKTDDTLKNADYPSAPLDEHMLLAKQNKSLHEANKSLQQQSMSLYQQNKSLQQQVVKEEEKYSKRENYIHDVECALHELKCHLHGVICSKEQALEFKNQEVRECLEVANHFRNQALKFEEKCKVLSSKIESLELIHSQKALADSSSYQDSAATPPLLQSAADAVKEALAVCASELFFRIKKKMIVIPDFVQANVHLEQSRPTLVKVALQALLCKIIFKGFEDPYFSVMDSFIPCFEIPSKRKMLLYLAYKRCRDREAKQLLDEDSDFKLFFQSKVSEMSRVFKAPVDDAQAYNEAVVNLKLMSSNCALNSNFLRLAKAVWVLHELALAFEPSAEIFQVGQKSLFNHVYMEDIAQEDDDDEDEDEDESMAHTKLAKQVSFMCVPGFTVRHTIIKSRVFCLTDLPPQVCDITKDDITLMVVDEL